MKTLDEVIAEIEKKSWKEGSSRIVFLSHVKTILRASWPEQGMKTPINIIFDGPPSHESGRFVEVETDDGKGIRIGEWIERKDGCWALRITELPELKQERR